MIKPSKTQMQHLLTFLEEQPVDFRPAVRWLMLGRHMAESLMSEFVQEPDLDQLLQLMRLVKDQEPDLIDTATLLAASSPHAEALHVEVQLDMLVERNPDTWNHPVQILRRPRSPYGVLLAACRRRLKRSSSDDSVEFLKTAESKLLRAVELEEQARRRRQQRRAAQLMKDTKEDGEVN